MSGKKGRSGRRPLSIEMKRRAIIDRAWDVYEEGLNSDLSLKVRMDNASKVVVKDMPTEITGGLNHVVVMNEIKKDDHPLRFNIGNDDPSKDTGYPGQTPCAG